MPQNWTLENGHNAKVYILLTKNLPPKKGQCLTLIKQAHKKNRVRIFLEVKS